MEKGFEVCPICGDCPRSDNEGKPLCVQMPRPDDCPRDLGTKEALAEKLDEDEDDEDEDDAIALPKLPVLIPPKSPRTGKSKDTFKV